MKNQILLSLAALLVGGCASETQLSQREPYVKPGLIMLTADQAARRGVQPAERLTPDTAPRASGALIDSGVEVYTVGRAVDPAHPELMHEEHVLYRRPTARWRVDAPVEEKILVGPRVTDGRESLQPLLTKELTTFLVEQRRATEANQQAIQTLFQAVSALNRNHQALLQRAAPENTDEKSGPMETESADRADTTKATKG